MKILILTPFYTPDLGPSAPLFQMLSNELAALGHEVAVISAVPHYPSGRVAKEFKKGFIQISKEHGVKVVRIRVPSVDRSRLLLRAMQFVTYQAGAAIASLRTKFDIILASNPAIEVWLPYMLNTVFRNKPAIYSIHDLYPHVGVTLGVFKNESVVSAVGFLEKSCLERSQFVRILSESFRPGMHELGVSDDKLVLIYDWVDTELIQPLSKDNGFSREFNLHDKFVVMYAGNIGLSQGLEFMLDAAKLLTGEKGIHFALVGEGAAKAKLMQRAEELGLDNVSFIPFQPRERLPEVLAAASVSMISLLSGVGVTALPSKTYSIFASGRPILACIEDSCEAAELVTKSGAGICIDPENSQDMVERILFLRENPGLCEEMGKHGRVWAEKNHSPKVAAREIEKLSGLVLGSEAQP